MKKMKKLKDLLKESYVWQRNFGEPLPTLNDVIKKKEKKSTEITEETLNEDNWDKINIPANIKRWMGRFVDSVNSVKLEKIKKMAILFHVIKALGLNPQELNTYIQRIRRGL